MQQAASKQDEPGQGGRGRLRGAIQADQDHPPAGIDKALGNPAGIGVGQPPGAIPYRRVTRRYDDAASLFRRLKCTKRYLRRADTTCQKMPKMLKKRYGGISLEPSVASPQLTVYDNSKFFICQG